MRAKKVPGKGFDGLKKTGPDKNIENEIKKHCDRFGVEPLDAVKFFMILARRQWLKRFFAHQDLFKKTLEIPGDIAEIGVFRGAGLFTWANLLESYCVGDRTKIVFGFDNWKGFVEIVSEDGKNDRQAHKYPGGFSPATYREELLSAIKIFDKDRFVPWKSRIRLVEGNIENTVPDFLKQNPGVRFSLLHFDCDLYKPTKAALESLWPRVSRGGLVLFDEYAIHEWSGETQAVDEFFKTKPKIQIQTLPWTNTPAAYIVKP